MLDPRAQEHEIAIAARLSAGATKTFLAGVGKCMPADMLADHLDRLAYRRQAKAVDRKVSLSGRIGRMVDPQWWSRNVRRELLRENEANIHAQGGIRRSRACYVSDHAMQRTAAREKANRATLDRLEVVNEDGHACNLLEVADASVSNPKLRRSELMVRCRGFEETAKYMGHEAVFLTITCPSRFHRFNAQGKPNETWTGATPKDAQAYLCGVWAKIRAEWKRCGYAPYGFRVAEPHHDGCPHWHILLFVPPQQVGWFVARRFAAGRDDHGAGVIGIAGAYALADCSGEPGAIKHRFTVERIDPAKGSATSYIAKYISKNIDGLKEGGDGMGLDFASGKKASEGARRVRTWASVWGIRQFQQIGGPSVTVWRELRRLGKDLAQPLQLELFEHPRAAADRALWALFWVLQGGPDVPRSQLSLKPLYTKETGARYGDEVQRVMGVTAWDGEEKKEFGLRTRLHTWTVQRAGQAETDWQQHVTEVQHVREARIAEFLDDAGVEGLSDFERSGEAAQPWTGVNNCTDDDEAAALRLDYLRSIASVEPPPGRPPGIPTERSAPCATSGPP